MFDQCAERPAALSFRQWALRSVRESNEPLPRKARGAFRANIEHAQINRRRLRKRVWIPQNCDTGDCDVRHFFLPESLDMQRWSRADKTTRDCCSLVDFMPKCIDRTNSFTETTVNKSTNSNGSVTKIQQVYT